MGRLARKGRAVPIRYLVRIVDRPSDRADGHPLNVTTAQATPPQPAQRQPMPGGQSHALAALARGCQAAARAVSLYRGAHPAIGGSLSRLVSAIRRLSRAGETVLVVHPATLMIDDRAPARPDAAIVELAEL